MSGHDSIFDLNAQRLAAKAASKRRQAAMRAMAEREAREIADLQGRLKREAMERRARREASA